MVSPESKMNAESKCQNIHNKKQDRTLIFSCCPAFAFRSLTFYYFTFFKRDIKRQKGDLV